MLKLKPEISTFAQPVDLTIPGLEMQETVVMEFVYMPLSKFQEHIKDKTVAQALPGLIQSWDGVEVPYSPAALDQVLDAYPASAMEIFGAYNRGLLESRKKN